MEPSVLHGLQGPQGPQGSTTHSILSHCTSHSHPWNFRTTQLSAIEEEGRRPGMEVIDKVKQAQRQTCQINPGSAGYREMDVSEGRAK